MRVLVFPRASNPYQDDLYDAMRATAPLTTQYVGELTPSQTINVVLLPVEIAFARARGARVLHVHWVYRFGLVWARPRWVRRVLRAWFHVALLAAAAVGIRIVWTAHNLVPHEPVFDDDVAARRTLARRCALVIAHSEGVAETVRSWGARDVVVIPAGLDAPATAYDRAAACARVGLDPARFRVLHFGVVREYKGVDALLDAAASLPGRVAGRMDVVVVGDCPDPALRHRLMAAATSGDTPSDALHVRFEHVADDELDAYLAASDVAVFPFRRITNSSSVGRALAAGVPVIVPALPTLAEIPDAAAVRYDPTDPVAGLAGAIVAAAEIDRERLGAMAAAARQATAEQTWPVAAARTWRAMARIVEPVCDSPSAVPTGALR